ncbi:type IV secretion system protein TrbL [Massilia sp. UYP11]|uniref:P-type conjugative transfer protein TrbL n=1 Tax=Massilia sp. UYP11 TaxID=1756385 RepID=UPI003D232AE6
MQRKNSHWIFPALVLLLAFAVTETASAAPVLDTAVDKFEAATKLFGERIQSVGVRLLFLLTGIQVSVNMIMLLLKEISLEAVVGSVVRVMMTTGFFYSIMLFGSTWLPAIINSFDLIGQQGSGLSHLSPSAIITQGIDLQNLMVATFNDSTGANQGLFAAIQNFVPGMTMVIICIVILLSFVILAAQMALTLISGWMWMCVTPLLMGFGGLQFTRDIAINSLKGGIAIGMKILVVYLIVGVAGTLAPIMGESMKDVTLTDWSPMYWSLAVSAILAYLSFQLPKVAADLMNGTASLSAGDAGSNVAMLAAGAVGAGVAAGGVMAATAAAGKAGAGAAMTGAQALSSLLGSTMGQGTISNAAGAASAVSGAAGASSSAASMPGLSGSGIGSSVANGGAARGPSASSPSTSSASSSAPAPSSQSGASGQNASATSAGQSAGSSGQSTQGNSGAQSAQPAPAPGATARDLGGFVPNDFAPAGGLGDASTASISGGSGPANDAAGPREAMRQGQGPRLQDRIRSAGDSLPQDGHTVGLAANITAHVGE